MDPRDDRGETKQALDEPSQKIICLSIEKGKRKKMATNEDMHQQYPGLQQYQHISEALSMSGPSASMLFEQQNQRPIPVEDLCFRLVSLLSVTSRLNSRISYTRSCYIGLQQSRNRGRPQDVV